MGSEQIYAQNFTYFWCVLFYSTGCPLLYPLAALFFFVQYWYQKSLSLRYHRRSSKFSDQLPIGSVSYLRIAVIMHAIMAYMMLSDDELLPGDQTVISYNEFESGGQIQRAVRFIDEGLQKRHTAFYQSLLACIVALYFIQATIGNLIWSCCSCFLSKFKSLVPGKENEEVRNEAHSNDFYKELLINPLTDVNNKAISEFENFQPFIS